MFQINNTNTKYKRKLTQNYKTYPNREFNTASSAAIFWEMVINFAENFQRDGSKFF